MINIKNSTRTKKFYISLFAISLFSLIIRFEVCRELYDADSFSNNPPANLDMGIFLEKSEAIFDGTYEGGLRFLPFYYAVFLPSIYLVLGKGIWGIIMVQSLLGGVTVWLTGICGAVLRNRKTGLIAALLLSLAFMPILYTAYILIATFKTFLLILLAYTVILALKKRKLKYWGIAGTVCSCLVLTRGNTLIFIPLILLFSIYKYRNFNLSKGWSEIISTLKPAGIFILFLILPALLMTICNSIMSSALAPPTSGGINILTFGWNPEAPAGGVAYTQTAAYWYQHSSEKSMLMQMWAWLCREPLAVFELMFRKFLLFWDSAEITNNITSFSRSRRLSFLLMHLYFIPTSIFIASFLSSIFVIWRKIYKKRIFLFFFLFTVAYAFSIIIFINLTRYRLPVIPLFAIFTAIMIDFLFNRKIGFIQKPIKTIFALITGFYITFMAFPIYQYFLEKHILKIVRPNAVMIKLGDSTIYADNGPILFGSHTPFPLKSHMKVKKHFAFSSEDINKDASLQIPVISELGKKLTIRINRKYFIVVPARKGEQISGTKFANASLSNATLAFRVKIPEDGNFEIEIVAPQNPELSMFIDFQRDYGRSFVNAEKINGEFVCRIVTKSAK
jgi:4-amino-4-deoxy-L-arabinose transferase-like glycosyltransferase